MENAKRPHVVILGGGFGGLYAARALQKAPVRVTLVDRANHHTFQPLLYQVATATLNPSDIAFPLRSLVGRWAEVLLAEVEGVDTAHKRVLLADGALDYDFLVVATGATHSYFGNDAWARHAPGLKTLADATDIRRRVLMAFELAEREPDPQRRREWLTFVIIGAGPTGVELAGSLADIAHHVLPREFKHIDPRTTRVVLLEGLPHVLPPYPERLRDRARRSLERLGVEVRTGTRVTDVDEGGVRMGEERLAARTVLWAAGVAASPVARSLGVELDRAGRVPVTPELTVPGHDDVFVIGDLARFEQDGQMVPGVAPAAMQQGRHAADNIARRVRGERMRPFRYWDRGTFAVIGRGAAVGVAFKRLQSAGFPAWLAWAFIHIMYLVGFRNRAAVLLNWSYAFFTYRRSARLITGPTPALPHGQPAAAAGKPPAHGAAASGAWGPRVPAAEPAPGTH